MRLSLLFNGRMPRTRALDYAWYDTPNIHLCTIADFVALARESGAVIERALALGETGRHASDAPDAWGPNLFAEGAIFLLRSRLAFGRVQQLQRLGIVIHALLVEAGIAEFAAVALFLLRCVVDWAIAGWHRARACTCLA